MKRYFLGILQIVFIVALGVFLFYVDRNVREADQAQKFKPQKKKISIDDAELVVSDEDSVAPGYTLYPISGPETITLLDVAGEVAHRWTGVDADRARLLPNCDLLVLHGSKLNLDKKPWSDLLTRASQYNWDGELVWSYDSEHHLHHDFVRRDNGNTLFLEKVGLPPEYQSLVSDSFRRKFPLTADRIVEVTAEGERVWEWNSWDHLDVNDCGANDCIGAKNRPLDRREKRDISDWTHVNTLSLLPENKWFDAGDYRFKPGNIVILPRSFWQILIIDRDTGKVVWRYRGDYKGGMVRGHEASMIPKGQPGAGNIIVLDNGFDGIREESYILEVNPVEKTLEWVYDVGKDFYTRARGSVQRLANGNTLISEDRNARVFEVSSDKEKVWEFSGGGKLIVRAHRYPAGYRPKLQ